MSCKSRASSANITAAASFVTSMQASSAVAQLTQAMPLLPRRLHMSTPSRPEGAATTTRTSYSHSSGSRNKSGGVRSWPLETAQFAAVLGRTGQHAIEFRQYVSDPDDSALHHQLTNGAFVLSTALLNYRKRLLDLACCFKVSEQKNGIGQVAYVHRSIDVGAHKTVLGNGHHRRNALLAQEA